MPDEDLAAAAAAAAAFELHIALEMGAFVETRAQLAVAALFVYADDDARQAQQA